MTILAIIILLFIAGVAFLNMDTMTLSLYFMDFTAPVGLVIAIIALLGLLAGILIASMRVSNARDEYRRREADVQDKLKQKEEELQIARKETSEAVNRARHETEMEYQMQQKDQEIEDLHKRILLMDEKQQTTPAYDGQVQAEYPETTNEDDAYPNDTIIEPATPAETDAENKQPVDPRNRI